MKDDFYTFSEYMKKDSNLLTPSMEDYLEMIYRLSYKSGFTRINELSGALNVQPPSVTRMVKKLSEINFVNYEKYGVIALTDKGKQRGLKLLVRHNLIENFLRVLGVSRSIFEETEKIEHTVNSETLECIQDYLNFLQENPDILDKFRIYKMKSKKFR